MAELSEYVVQCGKCNIKTLAKPITKMLSDYAEDPFDDHLYVVVQCRICYSMMLIGHDKAAPHDRSKNILLWPQSDREMSPAVPESLRLEHAEARKCFRNGAYTATVVMVRRTLEGVCAEHGIKGIQLFKALKRMQETGLIEGRLLEWAEALRVLGNEGAHYTGSRVARQDAVDALALAEAILNYMYVFSEQFTEFKKRREQSKAEE